MRDWVWRMLSILFYCVCLFFQELVFILSVSKTVSSARAVLGYFTVFQCYSSYTLPCLFNTLYLFFTFSKQPIAAIRNVAPWSSFLIPWVRFPRGNEAPKCFEKSGVSNHRGSSPRIQQNWAGWAMQLPSCMAMECRDPPKACGQQPQWGITTSSYHFQALSLPRECFTERKLGQMRWKGDSHFADACHKQI